MALADADLRRLRWRCRRGLLENDLVLARFLERHAADLDEGRLAVLNVLLEYGDNDLWDLFSGRVESDDPQLAPVVAMIRDA
ncbi:MAG TPA: succinate dehydrogenase assembly factor 2 [Burkholderiales bacterium]|nr:succinate dehydrogenase assembly factor 2 [Burkholderiales bacterium]